MKKLGMAYPFRETWVSDYQRFWRSVAPGGTLRLTSQARLPILCSKPERGLLNSDPLKNCRILEQPGWEGTSKDRLVQPLSSTLSNGILKTSSDGDPTMSLGRLFRWMIGLTGKEERGGKNKKKEKRVCLVSP